MIGRLLYEENGWVASAALISLLFTWKEIFLKIYNDNKDAKVYQRIRCVKVLTVLGISASVMVVVAAMNIVHRDEYLNRAVILDEITLVSLLLCVIQEPFVDLINLFIASAHK